MPYLKSRCNRVKLQYQEAQTVIEYAESCYLSFFTLTNDERFDHVLKLLKKFSRTFLHLGELQQCPRIDMVKW